jgi:hypothetical protein
MRLLGYDFLYVAKSAKQPNAPSAPDVMDQFQSRHLERTEARSR